MTGLESWDLTPLVSPYLDRHMVFPLLEYLDKEIAARRLNYNATDIAAARLALLKPTNMVDYAIDEYKKVNKGAALPKEMEEQRATVLKKVKALEAKCAPLVQLSSSDEKNKMQASGQWNLTGLAAKGIDSEVVDSYSVLARTKFDCGAYAAARDMLQHYIAWHAQAPDVGAEDEEDLIAAGITVSGDKKDLGNPNMYYLTAVDSAMLHVLWGKLACDILVRDWEAASTGLEAVKTAIEFMASSNDGKASMSALQALQQRSWLLHWSLFVYWNDSAKGQLEKLVELFNTDRYKQAVTTNAPHLLRYLTAAVLLCKRRISTKSSSSSGSNAESRRLLKNLTYVMHDCEYSDPIVEFVHCLIIKFDFDAAQTKLAECEQVLASDYFLCNQTALFMEEARVFVFENYCRIHNKIDLSALGAKLAMDQEAAERWIVDLIRNADLDAVIDTENKCVVMGGEVQSVYEQVMSRTKDLNVRSATLVQNLQALLNDARIEKQKTELATRED